MDPAADRRPGEDDEIFHAQANSGLGKILGQVATFSASQLSQATIFGLGIMPYISASIIFQLLGSVWPPLEKLQKEGESGPQENQRIHALRHGRAVPWAKLVLRARSCVKSELVGPEFLTTAACLSAGTWSAS